MENKNVGLLLHRPRRQNNIKYRISILNTLYFHYECLGFLIEYSMYYYNLPSQATANSFSSTLRSDEKMKCFTEAENLINEEITKPIIYLKHYQDNGFFEKPEELLNWKQYYSKLYGLTEDHWKTDEDFTCLMESSVEDEEDLDGFSVACEGELTFLAEASPEPKMNSFSVAHEDKCKKTKIVNILFLATDDDPGFKIEWTKKTKVISINHFLTRRIYNNTSRFLNINIRYSNYLNKDKENWCFPIFNAVSMEEKKANIILQHNKYLPKEYDIHIVCVGLHFQPHPDQPRAMFLNNDKIKISVINRIIKHDYSQVSNIDSYKFLNTELFFDILKSADYILCFNYDPEHTNLKLSGSLNMAFSFGARLIIPKEWQDNLQIRSAISYDFKDGAFYVPKITNEIIEDIYHEREEFIQHRNLVLDNAIQLLTPAMPDTKMLKL